MNFKAIGFGAEMWTEEMRQEIEKRFKAPAYNIYGLTEIMGPGVGLECSAQDGLHILKIISILKLLIQKHFKHWRWKKGRTCFNYFNT